MARHVIPEPTEGELAILNALWQQGPLIVRQVHESLRGAEGTAADRNHPD